ncbi:MAG: glycoside hydrolase family 57, partial [Bacillota bacterium]
MDGRRRLALLLCIAVTTALVVFGPCEAVTASDTGSPVYVALIWHNHQPFYKNTATGMYMMPWVRMHAVKDYYDMAAMLKDYPNVHATFNLVPSLIHQLDEYSAGAKDIQLILTEKPACELTQDDKDFMLRRFFDANWDNIIKRYPRYWELLQLRGTSVSDESIAQAIVNYTEQDFRDLAVWFNLAWLDPDFIEADPTMNELVHKARGFTEAEKQLVVAKHAEIIREVVPLYRQMQQSGQIEVTTTPFYHPIMPLLYDTDLARIASPKLDLPAERFARPEDVEAQLGLAVDFYQSHFGARPRGLWPSEQAVGQKIVDIVHSAGFDWMVSSEGVLARSLGVALRDGAGNVVRPDLLYRPYIVEEDGKQMTILFRDIVLSDKIGFSYSGMTGRAAARDLVNYLRKVKADLAGVAGPHIVTIALDGENCWEYYANDGKEFLHTLYEALNTDTDFRAVTVEEYLAVNPATERIPVLHTGSWISDNLETWIGEAEENRAWDYLARARRALEEAAGGVDACGAACGAACEPPAGQLARAWDEMFAAEGSDWFWWYGDDQSSGNDEAFDELFRIHLQNVYSYLGLPVPGYLYLPIIPKRPAVA